MPKCPCDPAAQAYIAVEKYPDNTQVQQMLQNPVKGICVFHPKTPPDVLYYLKDPHWFDGWYTW